jgi:hypothetical protein
MFALDTQNGRLGLLATSLHSADRIVAVDAERVVLVNNARGHLYKFSRISMSTGERTPIHEWEPWSSGDFDVRQFGERAGVNVDHFCQVPGTQQVSFLVNVLDEDRVNVLASFDLATKSFSVLEKEVPDGSEIASYGWRPDGTLVVATADHRVFARDGSEWKLLASSEAPLRVLASSDRGLLLAGARDFRGITYAETAGGRLSTLMRPFWLNQ